MKLFFYPWKRCFLMCLDPVAAGNNQQGLRKGVIIAQDNKGRYPLSSICVKKSKWPHAFDRG
ncbi:MAG: hypothetical protein KAQ71_10590 [Desulfobulbaceae bacterium]|nr:hypothetical protein [Desulfobulbaceae bacterium]